MSVKIITKKMYKCTCELPTCNYQWESDHIPRLCANPDCKSTLWNGKPDLRKKVPIKCGKCKKTNQVRVSWRKYPALCDCGAELKVPA